MGRAQKGFGLAVLLSASAHAGAALTVADWRTPGDGLVVRDLCKRFGLPVGLRALLADGESPADMDEAD
jgi:hypothetical protein